MIGGPSARIPLAWRAGGAGVGVEELHAEVVAVALTAVWSLPVGLVRPSTPEGWEQRRERLAAWVEQARREVRA